MQKWILLSAIVLLSSSCATTAVTTVRLECPPPIHLPTMTDAQAAELNVLSDGTYEILDKREALLKERNVTLCNIIESTHDD